MNEFSVFLYHFKSIIGTKKTKEKRGQKNVTLSKLHYDLDIDLKNSEEKYTQ